MADFEVSGTANLDADKMLESVDRVITKLDDLMNKLSEVDNRIDEMSRKEVRIDVVIEHQDKLDELVVFLDEIDHRIYEVTLRINIDGNDRLDLLRIHIDELTRDPHHVNIRIDTENLDATEARIAVLNAELEKLKRNEREAADSGKQFEFSLLMLAPLLIPLSAAALSAVGAIGGLASAFGTMAPPVLAVVLATRSAYRSITTFAGTLNSQVTTAIGNAGQSFNSIYDILNKNSKAFQQMNKDTQNTVVQYFELKNAIKSFESAIQPGVMAILTNGMGLLKTVLKDITPAAKDAAEQLAGMLNDLKGRMSDSTFQKFFKDMDQNIGILVADWGGGIVNIIEGIVALLDAFMPLGVSMSNGFYNMTASFDKWAQHLAQSEGFKKFVATVETDGPLILGIIGNIARIIGNLVGAMGQSSVNKGFLSGLLGALQTISHFTSTHEGLTQVAADLSLVGVAAWKLGPALGPIIEFIMTPAGAIVAAILALGAAFIYAYTHSKTFRDWIQANLVPIIHSLITDVQGMAQWFKSIWPDIQKIWQLYGKNILNIIVDTFKWIEQVISGAVQIIEGVIDVFLGLLTGNWSKIWTGLGKIVDGAWRIIEQSVSLALKTLGNYMAMAWTTISKDVSSAWDGIYRTVKSWATSAWNAVVTMFNNIVASTVTGMSNFLTTIGKWGNNAMTWFQNLPGNIVKWLGNLGSLLFNSGKQVMQGFLDGLKSMWNDVTGFFGNLTNIIPNVKGPKERDAVLLFDSGRVIIDGFINGLESRYGAVENSLKNFTNSLGGSMAKELSADVTARFKGAINTTAGVAGAMGVSGYGVGGNSSQVSFGPGAIQINNPVPEPASTSLTRTMQMVSQMGTIQTPHGFDPTV